MKKKSTRTGVNVTAADPAADQYRPPAGAALE